MAYLTCCSNDPKYKRRKAVHRKNKQWARSHLQASSRQAEQESATATATARPLNLSTMAETSMVSSQPSITLQTGGVRLLIFLHHNHLTVLISTEFAKR